MAKKSIILKQGQKFERLTIIKLDHIKKYTYSNGKNQNKEYYLCKCDCGNECLVYKNFLLKGCTKSCGCYAKEIQAKNVILNNIKKITHHLTKTRLYKIWTHIKQRCYNKKRESFKNYGARGITVCEEWKNDFMSFYNWAINNGYKDNLTVDRIDNNGNYEPGNCRWITIKEQDRNKRTNHLITYNNKTYCIAEWAEITNINKSVLWTRLFKFNWPIEKALTTKVRKYEI